MPRQTDPRLPGQRQDGAGHASRVAGDIDHQRHDPEHHDRRQRLAPEGSGERRPPSGVRHPSPLIGDRPGDDQPDHGRRDVGARPLRCRCRTKASAGEQEPRPAEREAPPPRAVGPLPVPIPVEDHEGHGADDEQGDERVEHADPRVHEVEEVDRQQPRGGDGPDRRATARCDAAQQPPGQEVDQGDGERSGSRDCHAPSERLVAEGGNARADQPLAKGRMCPAGEVVDAAHALGAEHVPAGVARVEDLVEDELHRPPEAHEPHQRGTDHDGQQGNRVDACPRGGDTGSRSVDHAAPARCDEGVPNAWPRSTIRMLSNPMACPCQSWGRRDSIEICSLPAISSWHESVFIIAGSPYQTR